MRLLTRVVLGRRLHVHGLKSVPRTGPVMVVGNHIASADPPLVASRIPRTDIFTMTKAEVFRKRFSRFLFRSWNAFPVNRHSADRTALTYALRCLADGYALLIYPEGTRSEDTSLRRAYPGVGFLALRSGAPVVCAAISGTENVLPKGRTLPRRAGVELCFGEPFVIPRRHPDGRRVTNQEAADLIMTRMASLLPEAYRGVYAAVAPSVSPPAAERGRPSGGDTEGGSANPTTPAVPAA